MSDVRLDDAFVQEAFVVELSAERRAAQARRDELDRTMDEGIRQAAGATRSARGVKRRRLPAVIVIVAVVSLLGWRTVDGRQAVPASSPPEPTDPGPDRLVHDAKLTDLPPPSTEEASAPRGQPAPHAVISDGFRFTRTQPGSSEPVAYDPCRPIHVVVNNRTAPPGGDAILRAAVEAVHRATGLVFVIDGPTDEAPNSERAPYQRDRYPERWAPVLVAWSDPAESPPLAGDVAGSGGSTALSLGDRQVYVTGGVTLDGPQLRRLLKNRVGQAQARAVIQHELGHLVGLNHVPDPRQLMNPVHVPGRTSLGAGDLTGLGVLGQGDCFPAV